MMGYGSGLGFGLGGWLWMLGGALLLVGVVVLIVWLVSKVVQSSPVGGMQMPQPAAQDANEVLRLRFARGEMTADEYATAKKVLETGR
jgi:putative membrane protein